MRRFCIILIICVSFWVFRSGYAQFTPGEIAQREKIEAFLQTAEIIRAEDIGEGITKPKRLYLKLGDTEMSGAWKSVRGTYMGHREGWQYEIAAYRLDKLLGLNMIPPTVEKSFQGKKGSLQLWVTSKYSLLEIMERNIPMPTEGAAAVRIAKAKYLTRAFDSLIANMDRTQQNLRYTEDWRTILIDHSQCFHCEGRHIKRLVYGKKGLKEKKLFRFLPRRFVEKLAQLSFAMIREAVGDTLTDKEINAVLARRQLLLEEIQKMIKERGEDKVLY